MRKIIRLKSESDLIYIKKAIEIGELILTKAEKLIVPNRNLLDLEFLLTSLIFENDATPAFYQYKGFPKNICLSVNEEIIHGIPYDRFLKDGDILKVDIGINYNGYFSDQAKTYVVGKVKNSEHYKLIYACQKALEIATILAKQKHNLKIISKNIEQIAKTYNLGILKNYCGHGTGFELQEEPKIPNYAPYVDLELKKGMVIAIEPMFVLGSGNYKLANNNWTVIADGIGAHEEKTIII